MADLIFGALLLALCFYVARTWFRWFRSDIKLVEPKWRSSITAFGFAASTISLAVIIVLILHGLVASGFPPYQFIALRILLATALSAIVAAMVGTGPLEIPTVACSVFCLLVLAAHVMAVN
jgi:hypothetical protein